MSGYEPTIGLEIHAQLRTVTKLFCNSKNDPDETRPNVNVCPICMGHPGTLPTLNREAVKHVLKVGVALGGSIADFTEWDRKSYFYPDIPKGYQISQYQHPLVTGGSLKGVAITRIHLEEDTARSQHTPTELSAGKGGYSLIDFNRAGVPLMELVTEPVIHSAKEAGDFARELQLLLRYLDVSDADMEKGHLRVEVNISVNKQQTTNNQQLGTKTEVKNINSFRAAEKAIEYETRRQIAALEAGEEIVQETRGWDDAKGETYSQRAKEFSHDYRYFPEPDLPKLKLSEIPEFSEEILRKELPELPWERRERYLALGLKQEDADMFVANITLGDFFDDVSKHTREVKLAANYIASDLASLLTEPFDISKGSVSFARLMDMVAGGEVSSRGAKDILRVLIERGGSPREVAEREGLLQQSDEGALLKIVEQVIKGNPEVVMQYKGGKKESLQFLIGQAMKLSKGAGNPKVLGELLEQRLA